MPTTIEDVARKAGVSTATVSRALRGLPNVAPTTRDRIFRVAQELNYDIHPQITRLASGRRVIGLVTPLSDLWFYSKFCVTAELKIITVGFEALHFFVESLENQVTLFNQLITGRLVDGIILTSLTLPPEQLEILKSANLPITTVETETDYFPSVSIDNITAAELATRHLINLGHKRIGLISGHAEDPWQFQIPHARRDGYRRALSNYGIELRPEYEVQGNFSYDGGAEAMKTLFSLHQPPTAVFAMSDEMAIGAMKTIRDLNLRIPDDLSIIGFDDNDVSKYFDLTTIKQPVSEYSEVATSLLFNRMSGEEVYEPVKIRLSASLMVRSTTGPPGDYR